MEYALLLFGVAALIWMGLGSTHLRDVFTGLGDDVCQRGGLANCQDWQGGGGNPAPGPVPAPTPTASDCPTAAPTPTPTASPEPTPSSCPTT